MRRDQIVRVQDGVRKGKQEGEAKSDKKKEDGLEMKRRKVIKCDVKVKGLKKTKQLQRLIKTRESKTYDAVGASYSMENTIVEKNE